MNDLDACGTAYRERVVLAEATGDPLLIADAHYDVGFLSVIAQDPKGVLEHEQLALDIYERIGNDAGAMWARQALGLANFLAGDYARARDVEIKNQEEFRRKGSPFQVADSMTFLAGVNYRLGDPADGAMTPIDDMVEEVQAAAVPEGSAAAPIG